MGVASLRAAHQDPFDRLLISQAIHYELTLVSRDRTFIGCPLRNFVVMGSDLGARTAPAKGRPQHAAGQPVAGWRVPAGTGCQGDRSAKHPRWRQTPSR